MMTLTIKPMITTVIALLLFLSVDMSAANRPHFYNVSEIYGVAVSEPNSICMDDNGFVWVGSRNGVYRFSDNDFKLYALPYVSMNVISVEVVSRDGRTAAYTNQGEVFVYDPAADRFTYCLNLPEMTGLDGTYLAQIDIEKDGDIWLAGAEGLYVFSAPSLYQIKDVKGPIGDMVRCGRDNSIVAGGTDGIYSVDTATRKGRKICGSGGVFPTRLRVDSAMNRIWVGTMADGLHYVDLCSLKMKKTGPADFPRQYVRDIEIVSDDVIWCGIDGRGIWELSRDGERALAKYQENSDKAFAIDGNGIQDMLLDGSDRIWVCSYTGGVSVAETDRQSAVRLTHRADNANSLVNDYVYDIEEDCYGKVWIGTNSGLSCLDRAADKWTSFFDDDNSESLIVQAVCRDGNGDIWAGTYSHGVYVIDAKTKRIKAHHTRAGGIMSSTGFVFDIIKDCRDDIWVAGMTGGIMKYDARKDSFEMYPSIPVTKMVELNDSTILLGSTSRILALDTRRKECSVLVSDYIIRDFEISDGRIWVATSGNGLLSYNIETCETELFDARRGLYSDNVNSIAACAGYLWLGTDIGLCRFDIGKQTVDDCRMPSAYARYDFTPDAAAVLKDGAMAWGTAQGVLVVSPESTQPDGGRGQIFIDDILLSGHSVRETDMPAAGVAPNSLDSLTAGYNYDDITFILAPTGTGSASVMFSHRLDGVDDDWSVPSGENIIRYSNLAPGSYTLHIRMHNPGVVRERSFGLCITPPFWATWWFRLLLLFTVLLLLLFVARYYVHRLNRRNAESRLRLFATAAHDLRTSLTLIKAPIDELENSRNLDATDRNCVDMASEHVKRLTAVASKLLDFQKIDLGKTQHDFRPRDIVALIRTRISMFSSLADRRSIEISYSHDKDSYVSSVDAGMIEQIVDNLLSNAIKYSPERSSIEVDFSGNDKGWTLAVADHGSGISKKDRHKLFREFYRGRNAVNSRIVGSGIGLALVKKLVDIHRGRIWFDSQENEGSRFEVYIPYRRPAVGDDEVPSETAEEIPCTYDHSGEDIRVLICEDNAELRQFMSAALGRRFSVTAVADGTDAWEYVKECLPDIIVSDIMMPRTDGFELCRLVKSTFETAHIPLILLSALTDRADELQGLGLGADDYMTKPFDMKTLMHRIASITGNRRHAASRTIGPHRQAQKEEKPVNTLNDRFVAKAVDVVVRNLDNTEFGKEEFAMEMGVSTSLLFKKIKSLTGLSIVDFIKKVRMEHALSLLDDPSLSITDIADKCGFSSVGYFSTVFKKHFGKTPSEYRK